MFRSFRAKLQTVFVSLGLLAIALTGWEASAGATAALTAATYDRLTAIRQTRSRQLEEYFRDLSAHVLALSSDESVLEALDEFRHAWSLDPPATPAQREALAAAYRATHGAGAAAWVPQDPYAVAHQFRFVAGNPHPVGFKDRLLEVPGAYGRAHARFHPTFHRYQTAFGFYDIFLIDAATERVLYTVFKEIDFGVHLRDEPYRHSPLGDIARRAFALSADDAYVLRDYERYFPSHQDPAAFIAAPIRRAGAIAGVLALQVSIEQVNRVLTAGNRWREEGLGRTGHAYAVGPDDLLRSDLRPRLENPDRYFAELQRAGVPSSDLARHSTAILRLKAAPEVARLRRAPPGTEPGLDARGVKVLRSHTPLNVPGLNWALIAEIEADEALAPVRALRQRILGIGALIAAAFFFAAAWVARSVTQPVQALAAGAERLGRRDFSTRLPADSPDELGRLAGSFNRMAEDLARTTVSKEELEHLAGQLLTAQEDERRRIARELHDDLSQRLAAVAIEAGLLERAHGAAPARRIKEHMAAIAQDVHSLSRRLHPGQLEDLGLAAALELECRGLFERGGPPAELESSGDLASVRRETQLVLYRIAQEALRNIEKHAQAENVRVTLTRHQGGGVLLRIADDGRGFDPHAPTWRRGLGLTSMEERVRPLGGRLRVESHPGRGTEVEVWLP